MFFVPASVSRTRRVQDNLAIVTRKPLKLLKLGLHDELTSLLAYRPTVGL